MKLGIFLSTCSRMVCTIKPSNHCNPRNELEPMDGGWISRVNLPLCQFGLICWLMLHWCTARAERKVDNKTIQKQLLLLLNKKTRFVDAFASHQPPGVDFMKKYIPHPSHFKTGRTLIPKRMYLEQKCTSTIEDDPSGKQSATSLFATWLDGSPEIVKGPPKPPKPQAQKWLRRCAYLRIGDLAWSSDFSTTCQQTCSKSANLSFSWLIFPSVFVHWRSEDPVFQLQTLQPTDVIPIDSLTFSSCFADWLVGVHWCDQTLSFAALALFFPRWLGGKMTHRDKWQFALYMSKQRARCPWNFSCECGVKCGSVIFKKKTP